jgi:sigma-B regulation protein RsbU (phosphoserine phosphatase)
VKVLVVDDDPVVRLLVKTMVSRLGHEVVVATSGAEAWAILQTSPSHIVLSDWIMPDVDGLELCRRIRAEASPEYTYVMLLTALDAKAHYLQAIDAGVDDFLTKPFDPDLLAARLRVAERILGLQHHVEHLEQLLPICMYCKKIRDEADQWVRVEEFLTSQTSRELTHGICTQCYDTVARPAVKRALEAQRAQGRRSL